MDVESAHKNIFGWGEDEINVSNRGKPSVLRLQGRRTRNTTSSSSSCGSESTDFDLMELGQEQCLPSPREKFLDLDTGEVYYVSSEEATETSSEVFSVQESSKFSSNIEEDDEEEGRLDLTMSLFTSKTVKSGIKIKDDIATEEAESVMKLVGCHTCLMYFMVSGQGLNCPKCKGSSLLDFLDKD